MVVGSWTNELAKIVGRLMTVGFEFLFQFRKALLHHFGGQATVVLGAVGIGRVLKLSLIHI